MKIGSMTCPSCAEGIEKKLNALDGVDINVLHPEGIGVLEISGKAGLKSLIKLIEDKGDNVAVLVLCGFGWVNIPIFKTQRPRRPQSYRL